MGLDLLYHGRRAADLSQKDFVEREWLLFDDFGAVGGGGEGQLVQVAAGDGGPVAAAAFPRENAVERRRLVALAGEAQREPVVRLLDVVELAGEEDAAVLEHRDAVGYAFDFVEQVG